VKIIILVLHKYGFIADNSETLTALMTEYIQPDVTYCFDLISTTNCDNNVLQILKPSAKVSIRWNVRQLHHLLAVTCLLNFVQPSYLILSILEDVDHTDEDNLQHLLSLIKKTFLGTLELNFRYSHDHFKELRVDILMEMEDSK